MSRRFSPSRRAFLLGGTAAVGLPFLPSALPRAAWSQEYTAPPRLVVFYVPNGMQMQCFTPDSLGPRYDLKDCLRPLAPVQRHVSVITGLANNVADAPMPGDHARGTGSFLTCVQIKHTAGNDVYNGISMDQVLARALGHQTTFPSLQVGIQPGGNTGDCTAGYSCAYTRNVSWADATTPLPSLTDPQALFDRMFGVDRNLDPKTAALRKQLRASVLDDVRGEAAVLRGRLAADDQRKLDQYLTAVREVEVRVSALGGGSCSPSDAPPTGTPYAEHVSTMLDLITLALECDITRIVSFMIGPAASNQTYDFIGVPGAHHQISHHQGDRNNIEDLVRIAEWEVAQFASLVERLDAVPDGGGTLLDSTLAYFSSEIEDGDTHRHQNLPVLLAGRANGAHATGIHRRYDALNGRERQVADLYLWMLQTMGVRIDSFRQQRRAARGHGPHQLTTRRRPDLVARAGRLDASPARGGGAEAPDSRRAALRGRARAAGCPDRSEHVNAVRSWRRLAEVRHDGGPESEALEGAVGLEGDAIELVAFEVDAVDGPIGGHAAGPGAGLHHERPPAHRQGRIVHGERSGSAGGPGELREAPLRARAVAQAMAVCTQRPQGSKAPSRTRGCRAGGRAVGGRGLAEQAPLDMIDEAVEPFARAVRSRSGPRAHRRAARRTSGSVTSALFQTSSCGVCWSPRSSSTLCTASSWCGTSGIRGIEHVQQEVRLLELLERGLEGRHQGVGQILDEPDGVGEHDLALLREPHAAGGGVEGREQLVLGGRPRCGSSG